MRFLLFIGILTVTASADPTFYKDVLPILQELCQTCHRAGEIGPRPLVTYQDTRPWAKAIREAVLLRKMPPWQADPRHGNFSNDLSLNAGRSRPWSPGSTEARRRRSNLPMAGASRSPTWSS